MSETARVAGPLSFGVLGPLEVRRGGQLVRLGSRQQRMLLACLLATPDMLVSLEELAELLWDSSPPPTATITTRSLVSRLRTALNACAGQQPRDDAHSVLRGHDGGYLEHLDSAELDSAVFERLLTQGRAALRGGQADSAVQALTEAMNLWRGPAFCEVAHTSPVEAIAARLEQSRAEAVEELVEAQLAVDRPELAVATLEPHLGEHPLRERGWAQRMLALYRLGRQADALAQYQRLRDRLRDELGVEPTPALRRLQRRILQQDQELDLQPAVVSGPRARRTPPALPAPLTPLVGRGVELTDLANLLTHTRLLTLTGVGGVGKTRLALALARRLSVTSGPRKDDAGHLFPGGVRLVELASITDQRLVSSQTAAALDVPAVPGGVDRLRQHLVDHLAERQALLVIDNCEQVIAAVAELVEALLSGCPRLRVLATSREPIALPGEQVYPVPPLSLPPLDACDPGQLADSDAVTLFSQRARATQVGFEVTAENAEAITAICRRLDGIPLALELAAGRLRGLAARQIADRLDDRFRLLTGGARTALPRQQTLQAAMDWSFGLLSPPERAMLGQLSAFPGTFDLAAVEATAPYPATDTAGAQSAPPSWAAGLAAGLVDKSMIEVQHSAGAARYRMLETVRAYCAEQLSLTGDTHTARRRHFTHYADMAAAHRAVSPCTWDSIDWLAHTHREEDNYRAAIPNALQAGDHDAALLLLSSFWPNWLYRGRQGDLEWFERALEAPVTDTVAQVEVMSELAVLGTWWEVSSWERSRQLLLQARRLADQLDHPGARWRSRYLHAELLLTVQGNRSEALHDIQEALHVANDPIQQGWCHYSLGWIAINGGHVQDARGHFRRAGELGVDSAVLVPHAIAALAPATALDGDRAEARVLATRAVRAADVLPLPAVSVMVLVRAAQTHLICDDTRGATEALTQLFELLHELGSRRFHAEAFEAAAVLAARIGEPRAAARYFGVSTRVRDERGEKMTGANFLDLVLHADTRDIRRALGEHGYRAAESCGRRLTYTAALADVRASLEFSQRETCPP